MSKKAIFVHTILLLLPVLDQTDLINNDDNNNKNNNDNNDNPSCFCRGGVGEGFGVITTAQSSKTDQGKFQFILFYYLIQYNISQSHFIFHIVLVDFTAITQMTAQESAICTLHLETQCIAWQCNRNPSRNEWGQVYLHLQKNFWLDEIKHESML